MNYSNPYSIFSFPYFNNLCTLDSAKRNFLEIKFSLSSNILLPHRTNWSRKGKTKRVQRRDGAMSLHGVQTAHLPS